MKTKVNNEIRKALIHALSRVELTFNGEVDKNALKKAIESGQVMEKPGFGIIERDNLQIK